MVPRVQGTSSAIKPTLKHPFFFFFLPLFNLRSVTFSISRMYENTSIPPPHHTHTTTSLAEVKSAGIFYGIDYVPEIVLGAEHADINPGGPWLYPLAVILDDLGQILVILDNRVQ